MQDNYQIVDVTSFEFTDDEILAILSWLKFLNKHIEEKGREVKMPIQFAIVSSRLRIDFALTHLPSDQPNEEGRNVVYLSAYNKMLNGEVYKRSLSSIIRSQGP